ncbi:cell division protein SepF [Nocardia terpenica]|uniref:cell division protein SepF n=1 Tax=Nocardia terpenica TaxID=455432 RepID=UPI001895EE33|nr:cell division protein SepF [Nocardia terpenica]MBF6064478.1 cell division protein SepF [Nocardia terpenica]MBF6106898.1 cell division protein SepF [Nocardia terpenica]MBF6114446.1 cell division protein SepF [Nocardia terpenica]MBF6121468.1 cell division protein SepF [Nocardia terpenica]MBF6153883.1 cell division protein SepF [Nocardia terpenica]
MSTLHRFKAYFGMVPLEDYEDDYVDDRGARGAEERGPRRPRDYAEPRYDVPGRARFADDRYADEPGYPEPAYKAPYQPGYTVARRDDYADEPYGEDRYEASRRPTRIESAPSRGRSGADAPFGGAPMVRGTTHGALAVDPEVERRMEERRMEERARFEPAPRRTPVFEDGGPLSKITTLRPRTYAEAAIIGERFRDGTPVIMDLVEMSNADARRLVDFAAGLAFALRGSFDKVATKVFLLSPADVDVSAEERRRIAETGFYNQK